MGHYAKVENGIVTNVIVADSLDWCETTLGGEWVQTSYNTRGGVHSGGKFPIHKNFAGEGFTFDGVGFAPPSPYASWTLNKDTYLWEAPVPMPEGATTLTHQWDEDAQNWVELVPPVE